MAEHKYVVKYNDKSKDQTVKADSWYVDNNDGFVFFSTGENKDIVVAIDAAAIRTIIRVD